MKIKNLLWCLLCSFASFIVNAQNRAPASQMRVVKLNCNDSLAYATNMDYGNKPCEFYFHYSEKIPPMYYIENFTHKDLYELITHKDQSKIALLKLVTPGYTPKIHDFVFCNNQNDALIYYYILKDWQEHKILQNQFYPDGKIQL
jgi:hypothetical protein